MSQLFQWFLLTAVTGSPIGSAIFLLVFWLLVDRFTLGVLPDPWRWLGRLRRELANKRTLAHNPHDGRARLELASLQLERGASRAAMMTLRPNLERGDDDPATLFVMGAACVGAGFPQQGEALLEQVREKDPGFRVGEVDLVLGRGRLARGDWAGARQALERLVTARKGTVEGRVLLSRALVALGDDGAAALLRDEAWHEYTTALRFQRRKERLWAWRARPSRPATYLVLVVVVLVLLWGLARPVVSGWAARRVPDDADAPFVTPPDQEERFD